MAAQLEGPCDAHLQAVLEILEPRWVIGVGGFAQACSKRVAAAMKGNFQLGKVLHPSPASPAANRGWAEVATRQLIEQGVWQA
jgi:single-strand selective monofunctional uracil DNA glycosylase